MDSVARSVFAITVSNICYSSEFFCFTTGKKGETELSPY